MSRNEILLQEILRIARQMKLEAQMEIEAPGQLDPGEILARAERNLRALHPEDAQSADE